MIKKSVVGRADLSPRNPCRTCFGSLDDIAAEFSLVCGGAARGPPMGPAGSVWHPNASSAAAFIAATHAELERFVREASAGPPDGGADAAAGHRSRNGHAAVGRRGARHNHKQQSADTV